MTLQSGQTSEFKLPSHLQLGRESCPTCGQAIPPDKLEEISGRIAARERERTLAITAQLEMQYAADKARAETRAKADLELERQQGAAREAGVRQELQKLREAKDAEIARMKEAAGAEAARIHQVATEKAELRYRDTLAAQERTVAEVNAKLHEAEQHASEAEQNLNTQREILEKAGEDKVNAEKARAFEEKQKLLTQVGDLKRALESKTNEELGEGAEINLLECLKAEFKEDKIEPIRKGAPGADIRHVVMLHGQECGTILYDSKNHKQWRDEHAAKLRRDQLAEKAEHAILSTHKFPRNAHQLHQRDGVLLANPARVASVVTMIRQHLLQLHALRVSKIERESKTAVLYDFITSARCRQLLDRIDQRASGLLGLQEKEIIWHKNNWKHQGTAICAIQKAKGDLAGEIDSIIGTSAGDAGISEAS
ncbi:MAG TPA: DUF2130 domain-containing protein [Candidatus Dormibacteraeota bacterium]|jgi:hypothetical protein|nr:DUF2130 domain-containing protein [Candidatus Dormibacteraeota bacterium]